MVEEEWPMRMIECSFSAFVNFLLCLITLVKYSVIATQNVLETAHDIKNRIGVVTTMI